MERNVRRRLLRVLLLLTKYPDIFFTVEQLIDLIHVIEGTRPDRRAIYQDILAIEQIYPDVEVTYGKNNTLLVRYFGARQTQYLIER